ncbi:MAG: DUF4159 domain-containing protein [Bryobacteraceae bacterium]|nr:DUF4159 domain-containing protein [Bryobacterales bacterium]MEB2360495.1 DUF4159 domain-containing protein [Bryobacterales bacterium]NUN02128.1 DUF4159 domain-containing protein [Bryobacteraceae bacterium]
MRLHPRISLCALPLLAFGLLYAQRGFRGYSSEEDNPAPIPADAGEKTEWAFARLQYSSVFRRWGGGSWATDYPKADRQFVLGVRRLTRLHTRSMEQVVNLERDNDEIYNWPWIYGVEVGRWELSDEEAARLRDYLLRGGFLMVDDFHGTREWEIFLASMSRVFPDRPIEEIEPGDPIFHVLYDLEQMTQVPGIHTIYSGRTFERDGIEPRWRAIYDDRRRIMAAICFNQDNGDAWEHADDPRYPEAAASQAYRMAINYIIYAMTH